MSRLRAVVFDLDGTLLDTEPLLDRANTAVLERRGASLTPELRARLLGRSRVDTDRILAEVVGGDVDRAALTAERAALLDASWGVAELMPGAADLVARLAARGLPMAIVTSSTSNALATKLARHDALRRAMHVIVCSDHPRVRFAKPAPDGFLVAAEALGVPAAACVAVEDAPSGVLAALAAGMRVVAMPASGMEGDPSFARAHAVVRSLHELDGALGLQP
jgi:pseudouridine-5'-monophosphatase